MPPPSRMADNNIREIISSAVRDALSRRPVSAVVQSSQPEESEQNRGKKRKAKILPSSFLKKKKGNASRLQVWDKDIICFPKDYIANPQEVSIPRGKGRIELAKMGLVGKIRLDSSMDETSIREEIRSVFSEQMQYDTQFPFKILHAIGGGAKALSVPNTSASFTWTAKEVASSGGRGAIYIWAQADMALNTNGKDDENECLWT